MNFITVALGNNFLILFKGREKYKIFYEKNFSEYNDAHASKVKIQPIF